MTDLDDGTPPAPVAYIQWKGTEACLDVYCTCGGQFHLDTEMPTATALRCGGCRQLWQLPEFLPLSAVGEDHWAAEWAPIGEVDAD